MSEEVTTTYCGTGKAARLLEVSQTYVRRLVQEGRLRAIRTDIGYMIVEQDLHRLFAARAEKREGGK